MKSHRCALLLALTVLAGCAGSGTMRVSDDSGDDIGGVSLAPEPEAAPDSVASPAPAATPEVPAAEPSAAPAQGYAPYGSGNDLELRRIGQWTHTGVGEARRLVIRNANEWAAFWSELGAGDRPEVDFTRHVVIAVAAGQKSSGGYEIAVNRVAQQDGELRVEVVETTPGPNCMTSSALTNPVDVVAVPGVAARSWSFVERKEVRACR